MHSKDSMKYAENNTGLPDNANNPANNSSTTHTYNLQHTPVSVVPTPIVQPSLFRSGDPVNVNTGCVNTPVQGNTTAQGDITTRRSHVSRADTRSRRSSPYRRMESVSKSRDRFSRKAINRHSTDVTDTVNTAETGSGKTQ